MLHKSFPIEIKTDTPEGQFSALVAVFGNVDHGGDRIVPGAFSKSIAKWKASGDPVPVIWNHDHGSPMAHIGYVMPNDMTETPKGLMVKGTLDVADNEVARQVHKLLRRRSVKEFSFGYQVPPGGEKRQKDGVNELSTIDVFELGPTLKGMNPATELHAVKSALAKAEQDVEETEQDTLETILELLGDFLETEDDPEDIAAAEDIVARVRALASTEANEPPGDDQKSLRRESRRLEREHQEKHLVSGATPNVEEQRDALLAMEAFEPLEVQGIHDGLLKSAWTAAYVNTLPDDAFLYVAPGGSKDADGKTSPRSLRHFPHKDASGATDIPHLRNALARIPKSDLPPSVQERLTARAQRILDTQKHAASPGKESPRTRSADPLRKRSLDAVLEIQSDGMSRRKSPQVEEPPPAQGPSQAELRRRSDDQLLAILIGTEQT